MSLPGGARLNEDSSRTRLNGERIEKSSVFSLAGHTLDLFMSQRNMDLKEKPTILESLRQKLLLLKFKNN